MDTTTSEAYEAAIIGAGPAGLSAALVLGRCRRRVIVLDAGRYRNQDARVVRGFLTEDGTSPAELRQKGRAQLAEFPHVELREVAVTDAARVADGFRLELADGGVVAARRVLLATGITDVLPPVPGARELHGDRVVPCVYCDGWELRDQPLAAFGHPDERGARFAAAVYQWSRELVLCTNGPATLEPGARARLARRGIELEERPIERITPDGDGVRLWLAGGESRWRRALFYHLGATARSDLGARLGARLARDGSLEVDRVQATSVPGLYAAGDATRDVLQAIVAAGEGAAAAVKINEELCAEAW